MAAMVAAQKKGAAAASDKDTRDVKEEGAKKPVVRKAAEVAPEA